MPEALRAGLAIVVQDQFCRGLSDCGLWCLRHRGLAGQTSSSRNQNVLLKKQAELKSWTGCREGVVETIPPSVGLPVLGTAVKVVSKPPPALLGNRADEKPGA